MRAVIFDLDDTLFDHTTASRHGIAAFTSEKSVPPTEALADTWHKLESTHVARWLRGETTWAQQRRDRMAGYLASMGLATPETTPDPDTLDSFFGQYLQHYESSWVAYPDARPALEATHEAGYLVAVLTNGEHAQQRRKLAMIGLLDLCGPLFAVEDIPAPKPDPRAFHAVCAGLGVEPQEAIMVGDHFEWDVRAAAQAGLRPVWVNRDDRIPDVDAPAHFELNTLRGLGALLTAIAG